MILISISFAYLYIEHFITLTFVNCTHLVLCLQATNTCPICTLLHTTDGMPFVCTNQKETWKNRSTPNLTEWWFNNFPNFNNIKWFSVKLWSILLSFVSSKQVALFHCYFIFLCFVFIIINGASLKFYDGSFSDTENNFYDVYLWEAITFD